MFTMITSFLYHTVESIGRYRLFLSEYEWHRLDNIGAIKCMVMLYIHLANYGSKEFE